MFLTNKNIDNIEYPDIINLMEPIVIHVGGFKLRGRDALAFAQFQRDHGMSKTGAMARIVQTFLGENGYPQNDHFMTLESLREELEEETKREENQLSRAA